MRFFYCITEKSTNKMVETNLFFLYKNQSLVLIFLMTCKAIGSPDQFLSSMQRRYVNVW